MKQYFKVILRNLDIHQPKHDNELQEIPLQLSPVLPFSLQIFVKLFVEEVNMYPIYCFIFNLTSKSCMLVATCACVCLFFFIILININTNMFDIYLMNLLTTGREAHSFCVYIIYKFDDCSYTYDAN